jgi:L-threonylcarbamoyladenylate synthase
MATKMKFSKDLNAINQLLLEGKVGILPTDTLYGIVGQALNKSTVERIYKLRLRTPSKPFIVLISGVDELKKFKVKLNSYQKKVLKTYWPGKVSFILPCLEKKFFYLHRGSKSLAFRFPADKELCLLLKKTGPLVAPSANLEGMKEAYTIKQAKKYFGNTVEFYLDVGRKIGRASTLAKVNKNDIVVLRLGSVKIKI